ncbi:MAG: amidase, partial [Alphaproteobacteria bacterium]
DRVAKADAHVVRRLQAAGAVLLGKTSCGALAYGDLWFGGQCRNPWNPAEGASGSSAGSAAAVAAGLAGFAIGTETMGSIISPANRTGAAGLRPTFGRIGRSGTMALCWSLDKIGVLARTADDNARVLAAINGPDAHDPGSIDWPFVPARLDDPRTIRLGYDPAWFDGDDVAAVDRKALEAAKALGMKLVEIRLRALPYAALAPIVAIESAAAFEALTVSGDDDALRWQADAAWPNSWRAARFVPAVSYVQMQRLRRRAMMAIAEAMAGVDALVHPNFAAHLLGIANHSGLPGVALRVGFIEQPARTLFEGYVPPARMPPGAPRARVPRSVSLTGHPFDDARLAAIAAALESALDMWQQRPPLEA